MRTTFLLVIITLANLASFSQTTSVPESGSNICLNDTEMKLAAIINEYRESRNLEPIELSASLTRVAQIHARDLADHYKPGSRCNLHSWSSNPEWSSCCYTPDHKKAACMWDKPRELTSYKGDGYEIAFYSTFPYNTTDEFMADALDGWKKSKGHNDIIINGSKWKTSKWKAMGVGVYEDFVVVWFGELTDPAGKAMVCVY